MDDHVVITLLRHGRTLDNEASRYSGWVNSKLSHSGRADILAIKKQHEKENTFCNNIDQIYTSDLNRTIETAQLLFQKQFPLQTLKNLREMHFGDFEGLSYDELKDNHYYQAWLNNLFTYELPNGESFTQFTTRIDQSFELIKKEMLMQNFKHIVLVVHGGVIRYLLTKLTNDSRSFFDYKVPFAQGYQLKCTQEKLREDKPCMSLQEVPIMESGTS